MLKKEQDFCLDQVACMFVVLAFSYVFMHLQSSSFNIFYTIIVACFSYCLLLLYFIFCVDFLQVMELLRRTNI